VLQCSRGESSQQREKFLKEQARRLALLTDLSKLFTIKPSKSWIGSSWNAHFATYFRGEILDETKDIYACREFWSTDFESHSSYAKYSNESVRKSFQLFKGGWM